MSNLQSSDGSEHPTYIRAIVKSSSDVKFKTLSSFQSSFNNSPNQFIWASYYTHIKYEVSMCCVYTIYSERENLCNYSTKNHKGLLKSM